MAATVTIPALQQMKRDGQKSVGVVAWDYQIARIADRAGVDFVSVGDSVGVNLWGHPNPLEVTLDEMLVCCKAVRRGVTRALVSCDFPFGPLQEGIDSALRAAIRLVKEGGADMVKLDGAAEFPDAVRALARAGIPVFAQFGLTPQTALKYGVPYGAQIFAGRAGLAADDREAGGRSQDARSRRRVAARFHQFRAGGRRRGGAGSQDSGDRRLRRRAVARRARAHGAHRHRLRREMDRLQDQDLRQRRQGRARRLRCADRRRARAAARSRGRRSCQPRSSTASRRATR